MPRLMSPTAVRESTHHIRSLCLHQCGQVCTLQSARLAEDFVPHAGDNDGEDAGEDGTDSAAQDGGAGEGSSSDEEAPAAGKQRAKQAAVLDSDDDSLDLD